MSTPLWLMSALAAITLITSIAAAVALWIDKRRARQGRWRIRENTLHSIELAGGWIGSLLARRVLHHKSRKASYRLVAAAISALHVAAWAALVAWSVRSGG